MRIFDVGEKFNSITISFIRCPIRYCVGVYILGDMIWSIDVNFSQSDLYCVIVIALSVHRAGHLLIGHLLYNCTINRVLCTDINISRAIYEFHIRVEFFNDFPSSLKRQTHTTIVKNTEQNDDNEEVEAEKNRNKECKP